MKLAAVALSILSAMFLASCGDVDNADMIEQEQLQRSMYGPEQQRVMPPPGDATPKPEPVPGEDIGEH